MKALITSQAGVVLADIPEPRSPERGEVTLRIHRAALCRTDLYVAKGVIQVEDGRVLGHEASGEIVACGEGVTEFFVGDRVVINPLRSCMSCSDCLEGRIHDCTDFQFMGIDYDGAFAEFVTLPVNELSHIPKGLSYDLAVYAEPLAATRAILNAVDDLSIPILVFGSGRIAELTKNILLVEGVSQVELSEEAIGQTYSLVIEAVNDPDQLSSALRCVKPGGALVIKSRHPAELSLPFLDLVQNRIQLKSVHYAPFDEALEYLVKNQAFIAGLLGNSWSLESYRQAFAEAEEGESDKTLFTIS